MSSIADTQAPIDLASVWRRLAARLIDALLTLLFLAAFFALVLYDLDSETEGWAAIGSTLVLAGLIVPAVEVFMVRMFAATPGKRLLGLRVVGPAGTWPTTWRAIVRGGLLVALFFVFPPLMLLVALWIALDPEHRGPHDRLAGTRVVRA